MVQSFRQLPMYGEEFLDPDEASWSHWRDRLSLDEVLADRPASHVLDLFQAGGDPDRHLDLRIWFETLSVSRGAQSVDLEAFAADGVRWWGALHAGNPATHGHGIHGLGDTTS